MNKKLDEYTKDELLAYVRQLQKDTKFGLVWNPKQENIVTECETKVPVLQEVLDKAISKAGNDEPTHLLIEGDNYHSLSVLNYTHAGKIDVIYIDPPYNKDKEFIYNDNYVDKEDSFRHSKWLSFMSKRLTLAKELLADHGVIFMSIDDTEQAHLRILCDQIFGYENFEGHIHWRRRSNQPNDKTKLIGLVAEHIIVYAKNSKQLKEYGVGKLPLTGKFTNPDNDPRGDWNSKPWKIGSNQSGSKYSIIKPNGQNIEGEWMGEKSTYDALVADGRIVFPRGGDGSPRKKIYRNERESEGQSATNWFPHELFGSNQNATDELKALFDGVCPFDNPKPTTLISRLVELGCISKNAIVLDFFAGSGSTGHAVVKLNAEDGGKRQFILGTNNENGIAENITYERMKKVISGYSDVDGIPANLRYYKTDFVEVGGLNKLTDDDKLEITKEMGAMIALREKSFEQMDQTSHWQTYENATQVTAIYYREDKTKIDEYIDKLNAQNKPVKLYVFGWGKNAGTEYASKKISVEDIPEPLIEVYKEIAK